MITDTPSNELPPGAGSTDRDATRSAIVVPTEIWHLARLDAYRHVLKMIESEPGPSHVVLASMRETLDGEARGEWLGYVRHAARTDAQKQAFIAGGEPDHIVLDQSEGVAVAAWMTNNPAFNDAFGVFQIKPEGADAHVTAVSSNPFRLVDLKGLPDGSRTFAVLDARHSATAAVAAIMEAARFDIVAMRTRYIPADGWRAIRTHASFFKSVARAAVAQLKPDDYRDWQPQRPGVDHFDDAPRYIHDTAGTTRCQQAIALTLFADYYVNTQEQAERSFPRDPGGRIDAVQQALTASSENIQMTLAGMNGTMLVHAGIDPKKVQAEVVFQTIPRGMPTLIVVPISALSPVASMTQ